MKFKVIIYTLSTIQFSCNVSESNKTSGNTNYSRIDSSINFTDPILDSMWFSKLLGSKDYHELNQFIHPDLGITMLFSWGSNPYYIKLDSFLYTKENYARTFIPYWIYEDFLASRFIENKFQIDYLKDPVFECDSVTSYGYFNDTGINLNILSNSINELVNLESYENGNINKISKLKNDFTYYKKLEKKSIRLIITKKSNKNKHLIEIFHITYINNKPYLFLVDCYTYDCSV